MHAGLNRTYWSSKPVSFEARLLITLRTETGSPSPFLDVRLQIAADGRWLPSKQGLNVEADALPELMANVRAGDREVA